MGGEVSTPYIYIVETEAFNWMQWTSIGIAIIGIGIFPLFTGFSFLAYILLKEILMSFPYDYPDYIAGKIKEDELIWPKLYARGSPEAKEIELKKSSI